MLMSGNLTKIEMVTNEWEQKRKVKTDLLNYVRTIVFNTWVYLYQLFTLVTTF